MKKATIYYIIEANDDQDLTATYATYEEALKAFAKVDDETAIITEITEEPDGTSSYQVMQIKANETKLKRHRTALNLSQSQLATKADVSLAMIQKYEQGVKDINKAQGATLLKLARALECKMEDLLEYE